MAQPTLDVVDRNSANVTVFTINPNGQDTMANSQSVTIASNQTAVPISAASLPLPTGAATSAIQTANGVLLGAVTETAPANDTASSGLNGRLQRIAQRITSLIAQIPPALGIQTSANSLSVTPASDAVFIPAVGAVVGATIVSSTAAEASHVIKASAGTLLSLVGYNGKASQQFIQIFNSTSVPADTTVPIYSFVVAGQSNFSLDVPVSGAPFTTGIAVSNSSTQATKTLGSADCFFTAVIK